MLPGNAVLLRHRGLVRARSRKWDDALADFDKAIAADPKDAVAYQLKAAVLVKLKKLPEALAALEKGHAIAPDNVDLLVAKGQDLRRAEELQSRRRRTDPGAGDRRIESADPGTRAALYEQLGEKAKALADVEKILRIKPDQPNVMRLRAGLLGEMGKYDAAVEELQKLHKVNPRDSTTLLQLGMLYTSMKKYDKADGRLHLGLGGPPRRRGGHARPGRRPLERRPPRRCRRRTTSGP